MTTPAFTTVDIVNFAAKKDAVNLAAAFNDLVAQRMSDAIDARKQFVANQMFNGADQEQEVEASAEDQQDETEDEQADQETNNELEQEEHSEESDENAQETN